MGKRKWFSSPDGGYIIIYVAVWWMISVVVVNVPVIFYTMTIQINYLISTNTKSVADGNFKINDRTCTGTGTGTTCYTCLLYEDRNVSEQNACACASDMIYFLVSTATLKYIS